MQKQDRREYLENTRSNWRESGTAVSDDRTDMLSRVLQNFLHSKFLAFW